MNLDTARDHCYSSCCPHQGIQWRIWWKYSTESMHLMHSTTSVILRIITNKDKRYCTNSWSAQVWITQLLTAKHTIPAFTVQFVRGTTTEWTVIAPADEAYYSFIDPMRMKGWSGLVGRPTADGKTIKLEGTYKVWSHANYWLWHLANVNEARTKHPQSRRQLVMPPVNELLF